MLALILAPALAMRPGYTWADPGYRKHQFRSKAYMRGGYSPEPKHDLVMAKVSIIINGQDGLRLDLIPRQEPVVQAVLLCADNLRDEHTIVTVALRAQRRDLGAGATHSSCMLQDFHPASETLRWGNAV